MSWPRAMPKMAITATASHATSPKILVIPSSSFCSGDRERCVALTMCAIWPICVEPPGGGHHDRGRAAGDLRVLEHEVGAVAQPGLLAQHRRAVLGHRRALAGERGLLELERRRATGCARPRARRRRPRAGRCRRGRAAVDSTSSTAPARRTRAWGTCSLASASTLARALSSWLEPMTTLKVTSAVTTSPVGIWPIAKLATPTISSMMFIGLESCSRATCPQARRRLLRELVRSVSAQPLLHLAGIEPLIGLYSEIGRRRHPRRCCATPPPMRGARSSSSPLRCARTLGPLPSSGHEHGAGRVAGHHPIEMSRHPAHNPNRMRNEPVTVGGLPRRYS